MLKESALARSVHEVAGTYRVASPSALPMPTALDFFAGSGLVTSALSRYFDVAWANDICDKKAAVYRANHSEEHFVLGPIEQVRGRDMPPGTLSWASFPCQDLSLAGNMGGIGSSRSGLVWNWLRIMDDMPDRPPLVVAENVVGLISAEQGAHYRRLHDALVDRGYKVGALVVDAVHWVPQSRPRVFVVGVDSSVNTAGLEDEWPSWPHSTAVQRAASGLRKWVWWRIPAPRGAPKRLDEIVDFDAPCDPPEKRDHNLSLIPPHHRQKLKHYVEAGYRVFPGYKRTRNGRQVLELRFDGIAGCLRTPEGGSSRQLLVIWRGRRFETRLITIPEVAYLMGAGKNYRLPGSYNEAYKAMGDAVAVPAAAHLAKHLLAPLAARTL